MVFRGSHPSLVQSTYRSLQLDFLLDRKQNVLYDVTISILRSILNVLLRRCSCGKHLLLHLVSAQSIRLHRKANKKP